MDTFRYVLGVLLLVTLPGAILFWFTIHPFIRFWRKRNIAMAYIVSTGIMIVVGVVVFIYRDFLLGADLGTSWPLFVIGTALYLTTWVMEKLVRTHLKLRTLVGVPELKGESSQLIDQGIYRLVRHPRYFAILVGVIGWSMMTNYLGIYVLSLIFIPLLVLVAILEERELVARFGQPYIEYQARVPRIIPTWDSLKATIGR